MKNPSLMFINIDGVWGRAWSAWFLWVDIDKAVA